MHFDTQATPHIVARTSRRNVILQTARTSSCVAPIKFQHDLLEKHSKSVQGVLFFKKKWKIWVSTNGYLVVWGPVVSDSNRGAPKNPNQFQKGILSESKPTGPQTTN